MTNQKLKKRVKIKPIIYVGIAIVAIALLYFYGNTKAPSTPSMAVASATSNFDLGKIITTAKTTIDKKYSNTITVLENRLASSRSSEKPEILQSLINVWDSAGSKIITAQYAKMLAEQTKNSKHLTQAATRLLQAQSNAADSIIADQLGHQALGICQLALQKDSTNEQNKINMATALIQVKGDVMPGVQMLLGVVKSNPDNKYAQFILGKFAVVSGQYAKAITRLQKVIALDNTFVDAYLELAKAQKMQGDISAAKATLIQLKKVINNAEATAEIDNRINSL